MADAGGIMALSQLATQSGLPLPTIHRLMRTLLDLGYVRQEPSREYALGPRLIKLGESATGLIGAWALPDLRTLVDELGEREPRHARRRPSRLRRPSTGPPFDAMFTDVGRRTPPTRPRSARRCSLSCRPTR